MKTKHYSQAITDIALKRKTGEDRTWATHATN